MYVRYFFSKLPSYLLSSIYTRLLTAQFTSRRLLGSMDKCVLQCLQGLHEPIPLPDNTPVRLGRTPQTQITEPRCSRLQVEVQVTWKTKEIKVTQLGANASAIDGQDLERGKTVPMSLDSTLFILKGMYPHKVVFKEACESEEGVVEGESKSHEFIEEDRPRRLKRPVNAENGLNNDCSPAKKHKSSEHKEDKHNKPKEKSESRKGKEETCKDSNLDTKHERSSSKVQKKHSEGERKSSRKATDYFSGSNAEKDSVTDKCEKDHPQVNKDRESSSHKKEKDPHLNAQDKDCRNKEDVRKSERKSEAKTDRKDSTDRRSKTNSDHKSRNSSDAKSRSSSDSKSRSSLDSKRRSSSDSKSKSSSDSKSGNSMKTVQDMSDDEDANVQCVSDKLQMLKQKAKADKLHSDEQAATSGSSKSASSADKRKSSTDSSGKCKVGKPAATSAWDSVDERLCIFTSKGVFASEKIAGFDIDGTIITTQSGRVFPKDMTDWKILMPEVFGKLKHLIAADYKIVFFTNQLGVGRGKIKIEDLQDKFEKVVHKLQVPVQIFISTSGGSFRKPALGMWQALKKQKNDGISIKMTESFYVGDAAGREVNWAPKKKKDFSCSDRLFALNAGLRFHTPEEFFLGHKPARFSLPDFDPRAVSVDTPLLQGGESLHSDSQEVVVLVGLQASGKSSFAKTHLVPKGYVHINQDTVKTWQKCVNECNKALEAGKSVVIDNTNVDPEARARYTECARKAGIPCRCFYFDFTISQCRHNERFREIVNKDHKPINEQIFNATKSRFKEPHVKEGFTRLVKVNFVPNFPDKLHEKIYRQFLLEK